jgi:hypothetical protein
MGLTVGCARCHDHKYDPIPTRDYYSLYGVFAGSTEKTVSLDAAPSPSAEYRAYAAGYEERVRKLDDAVRTKTDELVARLRAKAGEYIAAAPGATKLPDDVFTMLLGPDDLNPAVVRQWRLYLDRRGANFDPIWAPWTALSALPEAELTTKAPGAVRELLANAARPLNRHVAAAFGDTPIKSMAEVANVYGKLLADVNAAWLALPAANRPSALPDADDEALRLVLYGEDSPTRVQTGSVKDIEWYFDEPTRVQFGTLQAEVDRWILSAPGAPPHAVVLIDRPEQTNPRVFKRGNPSTRGEEVMRHFLSLIAGDDAPEFKRGSGRLEMARAIASADNPLTARVMINRIWAHHFGIGLVPTPSDFGTRSEPPSHPALLDWLAVQFVKHGWSVKAMHRLIMRSAAYRQASADRVDGLAADPENRLLWRMNRIRLDFESLRDALLATSGELDLSATGGPAADVSGNRRTIYASIDRQFVPDVFRVFDFANPDLHIPQRAATTVPQQALFFMNAPFATARARALAGRAEVRSAASDADRVRQLYRLVYQRAPSDEQVARGVDFVAAIGTSGPDSTTTPARPGIAAWRYGYGSHEATADRVVGFTSLPLFHVNAWQGGAAWPDATLGWVQLTATGGHAGNDMAHAAIRRWVAPRDVTVRVEGDVRHGYVQGNGVAARIVSSRSGTVGRWTVHNSSATTESPPLELKRGDTLDFVVDHAGDLGYDMFTWAPVITAVGERPADDAARWSAADDFTGDAAAARLPPLGAWEMYAHVLLSSNEFMFVD